MTTQQKREEAARWVRERAQREAGKRGQDVGKADQEVARVLREGDRKEKETGSR